MSSDKASDTVRHHIDNFQELQAYLMNLHKRVTIDVVLLALIEHALKQTTHFERTLQEIESRIKKAEESAP